MTGCCRLSWLAIVDARGAASVPGLVVCAGAGAGAGWTAWAGRFAALTAAAAAPGTDPTSPAIIAGTGAGRATFNTVGLLGQLRRRVPQLPLLRQLAQLCQLCGNLAVRLEQHRMVCRELGAGLAEHAALGRQRRSCRRLALLRRLQLAPRLRQLHGGATMPGRAPPVRNDTVNSGKRSALPPAQRACCCQHGSRQTAAMPAPGGASHASQCHAA